ncbi:MAG: hypothetical protein GIX03_08275, partial [Candidatus Eremiobacteraeota bacterium]|nr:hypothetical protein [Candidatus Eremiobacteraeota bacterium]MBC5802982.1 hypothetical protein [Candidatus Eremiobacteraeota bacterium]MBC5822903.1 hypothetical protein [Candidatus Eremiobacteraeota bacterium]
MTPPPPSPGRTPSGFELRVNLALKVLAVFVLSWLVIVNAVAYIDRVGYVAIVAVFGILVAYFFGSSGFQVDFGVRSSPPQW